MIMGEDDGLVHDNLPKNSFRVRIKCTKIEAAVGDQEAGYPDRQFFSGTGDGELAGDRDGGNGDDKSLKDDEGFLGGGSSSRRTDASRVNPTCPECGKSFPSDKSLFGHLRCHPERDYRGANPPSQEVRKKPPQPGASKSFTARALPATAKWPTARRGRKPAVAATYSDPVAKDAASILLLLADSKPVTHFDAADELEFDDDDADDYYKNVTISNYKRFKKLKINKDPELGTESSPSIRGRRTYQCSLCLKVFTSHQALGGHKASHNKHKSIATEEAAPPPPPPPKDRSNEGGAAVDVAVNSSNAVIAIKVVAPVAEHRCKICNLTFATGQALGGHQRRHFNEQLASSRAPSSTASAQSSESGGKPANHEGQSCSAQYSSELDKGAGNGLFDFDLNEVPRLE